MSRENNGSDLALGEREETRMSNVGGIGCARALSVNQAL